MNYPESKKIMSLIQVFIVFLLLFLYSNVIEDARGKTIQCDIVLYIV